MAKTMFQLRVDAYKVALRKVWNGKRAPCFVCKRYGAIAHRHHLIPVSTMARRLVKENIDPMEMLNGLQVMQIFLCPNHHALLHLLHKGGKYTEQVIMECSPREFDVLDLLLAEPYKEDFEAFIANAKRLDKPLWLQE